MNLGLSARHAPSPDFFACGPHPPHRQPWRLPSGPPCQRKVWRTGTFTTASSLQLFPHFLFAAATCGRKLPPCLTAYALSAFRLPLTVLELLLTSTR